MNKMDFILNLESPKSCRFYLVNIQIDGKPITQFTMEDGSLLELKDADDRMVRILAEQISDWHHQADSKGMKIR
jgi:hypothetical protein